MLVFEETSQICKSKRGLQNSSCEIMLPRQTLLKAEGFVWFVQGMCLWKSLSSMNHPSPVTLPVAKTEVSVTDGSALLLWSS